MNPVIAVTGPMAAGKNRVSSILEKKGFAVIDADITAHEALENVKEKVITAFDAEARSLNMPLLNGDGTLNRRTLAQIVFSSPQKLALHESFVHPEVNRLLEQFLQEHREKPCIINATVLYKTPVIEKCTYIIYVDAPFFIRLLRALKRDRTPVLHILKRFSAQKDLYAQYQKKTVDIYKVYNVGNQKRLEKQLDRILAHRLD